MIVVKSLENKKFTLDNEIEDTNYIYQYNESNKLIKDYDNLQLPNFISDFRRAAKYHKIIRQYIQKIIKPNMKIYDICSLIENKIIELTKRNDQLGGIAFPTGISLNNIIAHDTSNPNDERIFRKNDICKIDYGIHINGRIIDCAFTAAFNPDYENLLLASKEAMYQAIKLAGPDAICNEISQQIKEIIESYEVNINGKTYKIKPVNNIGGHSIDQYNIHSGKVILCAPSEDTSYKNMRMDYGPYAIECFSTTGTGYFKQKETINHYMLNKNTPKTNFNFKSTKQLYNWIINKRGNLPFTQRWISKDLKYNIGLKELLKKKIIIGYPPLFDIEGSYSSHFEHTIFLHEKGKEILTLGNDY